ncbi:hypothetical protein C8F04DRAFT_1190173 [Mycena alexandri]|uniref:Uncharacterized protein n=1 Tax=Mycena alexandri TaxID=1745969 RepID=A0AAD6SFQ5_9AGAR|nr:hypothetical protein C8F04DRAFT_1190173 [Mycena alexandri]
MDALLVVPRAVRATLWVRKQRAKNVSWDTTTKSQVAILTAGATIVATNALGFTGVILDVAAACIALLASTTLQRYIAVVEKQLDAIQDASPEQLKEIADFINADQLVSSAPRTISLDVYRRMVGKLGDRLVALHSVPNHGDSEGGEILTVEASGDAAGIAMQSGVLCFFGSVLCLAIASQPRTVWVSSSVILALITFLPLVLQALGRAGIRVFGRFRAVSTHLETY